MITLHVLQYLSDNGFGTIDTDLFFEKLPLGVNGIAIFARGGRQEYGRNTIAQAFDLYVRGKSDVLGMSICEDLRTLFSDSYGKMCTLPIVEDISERVYKNVQFLEITNIENIGVDENERVVYRLGVTVNYRRH
jgi:hypothetical protein